MAITPGKATPAMSLMPVLTVGLSLLLTSTTGSAASTLTYSLADNGQSSVQTVNIQDGKVWLLGVGGNSKLDAIFDKAADEILWVDHGRHRIMPINAKSVKKLADQLQDLQPLLGGLNQQISRLDPGQKARWGKLLGDFPLDAFDIAKRELADTRITHSGKPRKIAGISCTPRSVRSGKTTALELCLSEPGRLGLPQEDAETLTALDAFLGSLQAQLAKLVSQFGMNLKEGRIDQPWGIPIAVRETRGKQPLTATLDRIENITPGLKSPEIPADYKRERLKFW
jgi:hypothetical protein